MKRKILFGLLGAVHVLVRAGKEIPGAALVVRNTVADAGGDHGRSLHGLLTVTTYVANYTIRPEKCTEK